MPGVRVYQLAKELRVQSALILELLDRLGKEVHSDLSSIDDPTAHLVRERLITALANEKKRLQDEQRSEEALAAPGGETAAEPGEGVASVSPIDLREAPGWETVVPGGAPSGDSASIALAGTDAARSNESAPGNQKFRVGI